MKKFKQIMAVLMVTCFVFGLAGSSMAATAKININTASADQLEALQGVGPTIAKRIVEYRDKKESGFSSVDELTEVKGIGPKTLSGIRDMVTTGGD